MIKTYLISVVAMMLAVVSASAEPITREQAQKKAEAFLLRQKKSARRLTPVNNARMLSPGRRQAPSNGMNEYYVFDKGTNEGFIIVSGDDQTEPILGYCDEGAFSYDQMPPAMQEWLDGYARQIAAIQQGARASRVPPTHPKVEQMMSSKWSQGSPYNDLCPLDAGRRSVTGCVATAMAQILYYQREKSVTETTAAIPGYSTWTKNISVPGIEAGAPLDWDNMKDLQLGLRPAKEGRGPADAVLRRCSQDGLHQLLVGCSVARCLRGIRQILRLWQVGEVCRLHDGDQR